MYGIILSVVKSFPTRMKVRLYLIEEVILKNGSIQKFCVKKIRYNIDNDRMIVTNNAVFGFLKDTTDTNNPLFDLFDFLNTKKKVVRNTFEIDIFSKTIES